MARPVSFAVISLLIGFLFATLACSSCSSPSQDAIATSVAETLTAQAPPPTSTPEPPEQWAGLVKDFLLYLVTSPDYDPEGRVLHRYIDTLSIQVADKSVKLVTGEIVESEDDFLSLVHEAIGLTAILSSAGRDGDWGLERIELQARGRTGKSASVYVAGHENLARIVDGTLTVLDVLEAEDVEPSQPTGPGSLELFWSRVVLNIRTGPGTDFQRVGQMKPEEMCEVVAHNSDDSWLEVYCDPVRQGWVKACFGTLKVIIDDIVVTVIEGNCTAPPLPPARTPPPPPPPSTCRIKGNTSFDSGEKIYHLPGCPDYDKTTIRPEYGERWFCTEADALAAGWRKAHNCP